MPDISINQDDDNSRAEEAEDKELYNMLDELSEVIKNKLSDKETSDGLEEKMARLRKIIEAKSKIQKDTKNAFDDEMKKRSLENQDQVVKDLRARSLAIMRESKKKKAAMKDLGKELSVLRAKTGTLAEENSTLKIENKSKDKYIKELEEANTAEVEVSENLPKNADKLLFYVLFSYICF